MNLRQQALDFFVGRGWTREQAAGITANLEAESGLRPDAVGDGGQAFGLAQWHPDRQSRFAGLFGKPIQSSTFEEQLAFVHAELQGSEKAAGQALAGCTNAADAGTCVSELYERPADRKGEAAKRASLAERIFEGMAEPAPQPASQQPEKPMGPLALLQLFGPILSGMIPQIAPMLQPGSKAAQYAPIAQVVVDTITKAAGADSLGGAVQAMQADDAVKTAVRTAVVTEPRITETLTIGEIGGGVVAARKADLDARAQGVEPFWKSAVFWISVLLLPMVYWLVGSLIVGGYGQILSASHIDLPVWAQAMLALFGPSWTGEARSGGFNLVVGLVLGGMCGVYYGVSVTQAKQTAQQQAQSDKQ